jgi:hypothetical protein
MMQRVVGSKLAKSRDEGGIIAFLSDVGEALKYSALAIDTLMP